MLYCIAYICEPFRAHLVFSFDGQFAHTYMQQRKRRAHVIRRSASQSVTRKHSSPAVDFLSTFAADKRHLFPCSRFVRDSSRVRSDRKRY